MALALTAGFIAAAAAAASPACAESGAKPPYAALLDGPGKSVVAVRYQLRPKERPKGGEGPKIRKVTAGIAAGPAGQVLINASSFPAADEGTDALEPFDFHIVLDDGREIEAEAKGLARDINIAFLSAVKPSELASAPPAPFDAGATLEVGDEVFVVCLLAEPYNFKRAIYQTRLNAKLDKPHAMFSLDTTLPDLCGGGLVLRRDGKAVGFMGIDPLPESWQTGEPGNLLSLFGSANQGQHPGYLMVYPTLVFADLLPVPPRLEGEEKDKKGWLGITMQPLSRDLAEYWGIKQPGGVILGAVLDGSPANTAGMQPGDVIIAVDGEPLPIRDAKDLPIIQKRIRRAGAGQSVPLTVWRDGATMDLSVMLSLPPNTVANAEEYENEPFGVTVRELTYDVLQSLNLDRNTRGVIVSKTERAGWSQVAGIDRGDIVQKIDGAGITNLSSFRSAMEKAEKDKRHEVSFLLLRAYRTRFARVKTDWK